MKGAILIIGDNNFTYLQRLNKQLERFVSDGLELYSRNFDDVLKGKLPSFNSGKIITMLFYPYGYKNKHVGEWMETDGVYGGPSLGGGIADYYDKIDMSLRNKYGKKIEFVNPVYGIKTCRDKSSIKKALTAKGIPNPREYYPKSMEDLFSLLNTGKTLFVKVRFGGSGRAITYLTSTKQYTNFGWNGHKIENHGLEERDLWPFIDVSGDTKFLEELLTHKGDLIFEEEINFPLIENKKFDLRIYVIYNTVPFILPRSNDPKKIVTNWSQGGTIEEQEFLKKIPEKALNLAKKRALDAAKAAGDLKYVGLDILFSKDYKEAYVIEGQTDCGLPKKNRFDILEYLAKAMIKQFE